MIMTTIHSATSASQYIGISSTAHGKETYMKVCDHQAGSRVIEFFFTHDEVRELIAALTGTLPEDAP